jgi:hypothetical protein
MKHVYNLRIKHRVAETLKKLIKILSLRLIVQNENKIVLHMRL